MRMGISLVNSVVAEEISYIYFKDIEFNFAKTKIDERFNLEILAMQIDNQQTAPENAVVLK
jgi:hypothetical protein